MRRPMWRGVLSVAACLMLLLAACGGDDDDGGTTGGDQAAEEGGEGGGSAEESAQAAEERLAPFLEPATEIQIDEPLSEPPPDGISVYWLEGNIQSILPLTEGFEDATDALGWDLTTVTYDPADPQGPSAAMQQAIDADADYIAVSGQTVDILGAALDAAKAAEIPVVEISSTDEVGGEENGIYANVLGPGSSEASFPVVADYVIADSGGDAKVLFVNIPDFAILQTVADATNGRFEEECPDCEVTPLDVTINDLTSGAVGSQVVSALQSNPDIEYVFLAIGDLASGLPDVLAGAGVAEQVKVVGGVPNPEQIQSLIDGTSHAWIPLPRAGAAWTAVDAMARHSVGMEIDPESHEILPIELWTQDNVPTPAAEYEGPQDYQQQFTELWGVSSS